MQETANSSTLDFFLRRIGEDIIRYRKAAANSTMDTSDTAVLALLKRIKETDDPNEIRQLSDQLERVIFHNELPTQNRRIWHTGFLPCKT